MYVASTNLQPYYIVCPPFPMCYPCYILQSVTKKHIFKTSNSEAFASVYLVIHCHDMINDTIKQYTCSKLVTTV